MSVSPKLTLPFSYDVAPFKVVADGPDIITLGLKKVDAAMGLSKAYVSFSTQAMKDLAAMCGAKAAEEALHQALVDYCQKDAAMVFKLLRGKVLTSKGRATCERFGVSFKN